LALRRAEHARVHGFDRSLRSLGGLEEAVPDDDGDRQREDDGCCRGRDARKVDGYRFAPLRHRPRPLPVTGGFRTREYWWAASGALEYSVASQARAAQMGWGRTAEPVKAQEPSVRKG
jgi:hypothetical protein